VPGSPTVLITSYLDPADVERIARSETRPRVLYEPQLLPVPRYVADHGGVRPDLTPAQDRQWAALLEQADVAWDFDWQAPDRLPQRAPRLRWVQATSAGVGGFLQRTGLHDTDLEVTTAAGVHAVPLAEFAVTGALYFVKGVPELLRRQQQHRWERYTTSSLAGRTVTVVGLGGIGRQVVTTFCALGTRVIAVGRPGGSYDLPGDVELVDTRSLATVLPRTDVLVLCCPLTPETEGLIGAAELGSLPPTAVLVNLSRGQVVDEAALTTALQQQRLTGAALDVFATEPLPADSPLWGMDSVLVSPHSASTVSTENTAIVDLFLDNLSRYRDGRPLRNRYVRERGY
jgi:glyoxylate/hydroxypyruvate reductase